MNNLEIIGNLKTFREGEMYGIDIRIGDADYLPGDTNSIRDCICNICNKIEKFKEFITDDNGIPRDSRLKVGFELRFKRADGTIIDNVTVDNSEDIKLTERLVTTFCLV